MSDLPQYDFYELAGLYEAIISFDNELDIYRCVSEHLPRLIDADRASMAILHPETDELEITAVNSDLCNIPAGSRLPADQSMIGQAISEGAPRIWTVSDHVETQDGFRLANHGFISCMSAPLIFRNGVAGTLNVASKTVRYDEVHLDVLRQLANLVGAGIERLNLIQDSLSVSNRYQNYASMLEALNVLGEALNSITDIHSAIARVAQFATPLFSVKRISFCELSETGEEIRIMALSGKTSDSLGTEISLKECGLEQVFATGELGHFSDLSNSPSRVHQSLGRSGMKHLWSMPICNGDKVVAVLNIGMPAQSYDIEDVASILKMAGSLMNATVKRIWFHESTENRLRTLIDDNPTLLVVLDSRGTIEQVSQFGARLLGYSPETLVGMSFVSLHPSASRDAIRQRIPQWLSDSNDGVDVFEIQMYHENRTARWTRQTARLTHNADGERRVLVVCDDIHDMKTMSEQMDRQARADALTGLPNRYEFTQRLQQQLDKAASDGTELSVMFIDIDNFKDINDTLGHQVGDEVLCEMARRIESTLRHSDTVARIGGDEFLVLISDNSDEQLLIETVKRIVASLNEYVLVNHHRLKVTGSIGVARYPVDGQTDDQLIKNADISMYRAKDLGRNGYQFYSQSFTQQLTNRILLEEELRSAIGNNELSLVFQPQYDLVARQPYGVEALLRWHHPDKGFISPDEFIPLAESCGLIESLTDWVLENSLQTLKRLHRTHPGLRVAVNISAIEFGRQGDLFERVRRALALHDVHPSMLELEITETALLKNPEQATSLVNEFYTMGVMVAIDDFGTGYSSLSYLVHLPISSIKIDRSFVDDIENDSRKRAVVKGIIAISNSVDVGCVAEGVENAEQLDILFSQGCCSFQGYHLSRPTKEEDLIDALAFFEQRRSA